MRRFKTGKIPSDVLIKSVFRYGGSADPSVILRSSIGEDAALISFGKNVLVLKTDPVTGTASDIGWLAVNVNANDLACRGAKPRWFLCDLLLPENSTTDLIESIMKQIDRAAKQVGVAVVGGHTEVTPGLKRPIVIGYMAGLAKRADFVTSSGARKGDRVIMTKSAGIEGTAILASDFAATLRKKIPRHLLTKARGMTRLISVVEDASTAMRARGVRAMHDPTEGGLLQGLWELAEASKVGFHIHESAISVDPATTAVCSALRVNPLRLLGSGCLLIAATRQKSKAIVRGLRRRGIEANVIGAFTDRRHGRRMMMRSGREVEIRSLERDELYKVIEKHRLN
jgi:hydrogenase maturation factor